MKALKEEEKLKFSGSETKVISLVMTKFFILFLCQLIFTNDLVILLSCYKYKMIKIIKDLIFFTVSGLIKLSPHSEPGKKALKEIQNIREISDIVQMSVIQKHM